VQANVYRAEGNEAQLFLKLVTFCRREEELRCATARPSSHLSSPPRSLVSETLPKHRDYLQPRYASDKARYIKARGVRPGAWVCCFLTAPCCRRVVARSVLESEAHRSGGPP